jgi:hypothetical protein
VSAPTVEPVSVSGWYEEADGAVAEYQWRAGSLVRARAAASWADVPRTPSWATPESHPDVDA